MAKILVVDENPLILRFCQMVLTKAGFDIIPCASTKQALKTIQNQVNFSTLLVDAALHTPSSAELLRSLDEHSETCNIPVIVLSCQPKKDDFFLQDFPAVIQIVQKPFAPPELLHAVSKTTLGKTIAEIVGRRKKRAEKSSRSHVQETSMEKVLAPIPMENRPAIQGNLQFMPLAEIVQLLGIQRKTGVLKAQKQNQKAFIFIEKGHIHFATSQNLKSEFQIGRILLQMHALKPALLNKILNHHGNHELPLGRLLVNKKHIQPKHLEKALKEQTCTLFYEILRWQEGYFSFEPLEHLPELARAAQLGLRVESLVLEGYRRVDEWKVLEREVGHAKTVLERTAQSTVVLNSLSRPEKNILANVNGTSTIEEIANRVLLPRFEFFKTCQQLVQQKILQPRNRFSEPHLFNA